MARTKAKTKAAPAAQTREEAERLVGRIGELQRELQRRDADLGDAIANIKTVAEGLALPLKAELVAAQGRVQAFCEANRDLLTGDGKTKTVQMATGKVSWRQRPPSVRLSKVDSVIAFLRQHGMDRFLRTKVEVDKEAMLRAPEQVFGRVPGVMILSEGEDFVIEPFEAELVEAQS